jgi:hypothetical protein
LAHGGPCGDPQHGYSEEIAASCPCKANSCIVAFISKIKAECLNTDWFPTLAELAEKPVALLRYDNQDRPHGAIGDKAPIKARILRPRAAQSWRL